MPLKIGSSSVSAIKIGSTDVSKVYVGSSLVYSAIPATQPSYSPEMVTFDPTGDRFEAQTPIADYSSRKVLMACRLSVNINNYYMGFISGDTVQGNQYPQNGLAVIRTSDNSIRLEYRQYSSPTCRIRTSPGTVTIAAGELDIVMVIDHAADVGQVYINGVADPGAVWEREITAGYTYQAGDIYLNVGLIGTRSWDGTLGNFFMDFGTSYDLTNSTDYDKFWDGDGKLKDMSTVGTADYLIQGSASYWNDTITDPALSGDGAGVKYIATGAVTP